jgi:hypothetical protein
LYYIRITTIDLVNHIYLLQMNIPQITRVHIYTEGAYYRWSICTATRSANSDGIAERNAYVDGGNYTSRDQAIDGLIEAIATYGRSAANVRRIARLRRQS